MSTPRIGVFLSSEEHDPRDLLRFGAAAVEHGFTDISVSDHYHPWIEAQGSSHRREPQRARHGSALAARTRPHGDAGGGRRGDAGPLDELAQELRTTAHFEQAVELVDEETATASRPCGPDPEVHAESLRTFLDAGADEIHLQQVGQQQAEAYAFYRDDVLPRL